MEAHPPYRLPKGLHPSGLPAFRTGDTLQTSCQRGRSPLDSPLSGRGHPPNPCQWGCTPLDSPLAGASLLPLIVSRGP